MAVEETIEQRDETSPPVPVRPQRAWRWRRWVVLALVAVLALGVWHERERHANPPLVATNSSASVPLPPTDVAPRTEVPAWIRYAVPAAATNRPRIAVVIDGLGADRAATARAIALPPAVTLSFVAYADELADQTAAARRAGHELLLHIPMEPVSVSAAMGAYGLGRNMPHDELVRRLRWDLARIDNYVGERIRERRTELGRTQEELGRALKISYQQVQKYETAANRVSAGRLYELARELEVDVSYF